MNEQKPKYIYAYDPNVKKRVVYVDKGSVYISMVSGYEIKKRGLNEKI